MIETISSGIQSLVAREDLTDAQREEMFALLSRYFDGVTREQFERDLDEKNWVVEVRHGRRLTGFSTLLICDASSGGQAITAIYSGDTIVAPEAWGSPALARTWIAGVNHLRAAFPDRPCHWLLLTSGFRTYRFLSVFWKEFFPCYTRETPISKQRLLEDLARVRYGECYYPELGIVRFPRPQSLRGSLREISDGRTTDAHISFFLSANPGHQCGDELVCLTEISEENLTLAGRRMLTSRRT